MSNKRMPDQQKIEKTIRSQRAPEVLEPVTFATYGVDEMNTEDSLDTLLQERGSRYGKFVDHAQVSQDLKRVIWERSHDLTDSQHESLEMIFHKIGRIVCGDPNYIDSWDDIAGYAKLVADQLRGVNQ